MARSKISFGARTSVQLVIDQSSGAQIVWQLIVESLAAEAHTARQEEENAKMRKCENAVCERGVDLEWIGQTSYFGRGLDWARWKAVRALLPWLSRGA
jgi:hypothetical protein